MRKSSLNEDQMTTAEYVERAAWMSKELTRAKTRGPGDLENAMRAIEREYGIDYWTLWRLRYRAQQIKTICVSVFARLEAAYRCECDRQREKLEHELAITRLIAGPAAPAVVAAEIVVGEAQAAQSDAEDISEAE